MEHLYSLSVIALVSLLGAISPGPDFFIVVRNSMIYSRKAGFFTALGVSLALLIHLSYTIVGIDVLLAENSFFYSILKYVGAAYLCYLGVSGLTSAFKNKSRLNLDYAKSDQEISNFSVVKQGFLTNLLNPKAAMFFISLFSQFISSETPTMLRIEYGIVNWTVTLSWFLFLSYLITGRVFKERIERFRSYIDGVMGGFLILLGIKMLFI
jgi:RhtB (resistance to homoserine/threonine) family protein